MPCQHCGAALGRDAAWCGMCLAPVPGHVPVPPYGTSPYGAAAAPPGHPPGYPPGYAAPPEYAAPAYDAPGYGAPGYGAPGSAAPGSAAPGYAAPGYGAPGHGAPGYAAPGYGAPGYAAPGYGAPGPTGPGATYAAPGPFGGGHPAAAPPGHPPAGYPAGSAPLAAPFAGPPYAGSFGAPAAAGGGVLAPGQEPAYHLPGHPTGWPAPRPPEWPSPYHRPPPPPEPTPEMRAAGWTTFAAIAVGALMQLVLWLLTANQTIENEAAIRYSIVTVIGVYAVVTYLVVSRIQSDGHPLRWVGSWGRLPGAAAGLLLGGGVAWTMLSISQAEGVEGGDPWMALLVSEGTFPYIAAAFLIVCVAAPIVEELLFRGLLLASLLGKGTGAAVWISSFAFAAWHLNPDQLKYYSIAGALLGLLFLKQGLVCSMAAHAAFNGTLLLAAVAYAVAPGPTVVQGDLTLKAPDGWHAVDDAPFGYLHGPSRAEVLVIEMGGTYDGAEAAELVAKVQLGTMPELSGFDVRADTARTVELPAGEAVRVRVVHEGRDGDLVMLPTPHALYVVVLASGGSASVRDDFEAMLRSIVVADG